MATAAVSLSVHPITFRYRLRGAVDLSTTDLADGSARFRAMLELRVLLPMRGTPRCRRVGNEYPLVTQQPPLSSPKHLPCQRCVNVWPVGTLGSSPGSPRGRARGVGRADALRPMITHPRTRLRPSTRGCRVPCSR
ncbi:helix-turn-helix domain-containing protein [Arthrobacter sp. MSA 4-2]|uniref:helix-turn-helix domain-containing protein n=1 Tax=Arthrobacter sp. MSA 4-2 TaxID=2794349 RepID=UPI0018E6FE65|nr:helix-turn-helix domain-containing protein [Arthrobacter sp. MSA 4-2]